MSSSAFDPRSSPLEKNVPGEPSATSDPRLESDRKSQRELFEEVMRETQEICEDGAAIDPEEKAAILRVAQKFHGRPFSLHPVLGELVHAVLCSRLSRRADSSGVWREISAQIAETLFEDPVASRRLQSFWGRLMDSCHAMRDE